MIVSAIRQNPRPARPRGGWQFRVSPEEKRRAQERQSELFKRVPAPVRAVLVILAAYVMINFLLFVSADLGTPAGPVGARHLTDRGKFVRDLSEAEYHQIQARVVRGFSGHWMIFSAAPLAYFRYVAPASASDPASAGQELD